MGNAQSNAWSYQRLSNVMPSMDRSGCNSPATSWFDKSSKPFATEKDRDQFICKTAQLHFVEHVLTPLSDATITVLSQNGTIKLEQHDFRLLYSRRENDRLVARIVAEKEGIIKAQVEPHEDGKDQAEAFKALRRHVELALDRILRDVPGASNLPSSGSPLAIAGPSSRMSPPPSLPARHSLPVERQERGGSIALSDAPPAYGKAVKDWRSTDDSKER